MPWQDRAVGDAIAVLVQLAFAAGTGFTIWRLVKRNRRRTSVVESQRHILYGAARALTGADVHYMNGIVTGQARGRRVAFRLRQADEPTRRWTELDVEVQRTELAFRLQRRSWGRGGTVAESYDIVATPPEAAPHLIDESLERGLL